jgi:hypothetical protein
MHLIDAPFIAAGAATSPAHVTAVPLTFKVNADPSYSCDYKAKGSVLLSITINRSRAPLPTFRGQPGAFVIQGREAQYAPGESGIPGIMAIKLSDNVQMNLNPGHWTQDLQTGQERPGIESFVKSVASAILEHTNELDALG